MSKDFWQKLNKPFFVLAPMADVTDAPFRRIIAKYGKPDVTYTEFVSADGLFLGGYDALLKDLEYTEEERPIVAQFFTSDPKRMQKAAELAVKLGFDGIDINMGCPDRSIEKQGAGSALMKNPELAAELIRSAKAGAESATPPAGGRRIPVSVKTRVGYNKDELDQWLPVLLKAEPTVITIHARTRKQMSKVPADWSYVKRAVEIRNKLKSKTLICGNGDVTDIKDAKQKAKETGADGIMLGRAIFGNPWLFDENREGGPPAGGTEEKLKVLVEHTKLFEKIAPHKNFSIMKKHYKAYVEGFDGAKELRIKLMQAKTASDVEKTVNEYLK